MGAGPMGGVPVASGPMGGLGYGGDGMERLRKQLMWMRRSNTGDKTQLDNLQVSS